MIPFIGLVFQSVSIREDTNTNTRISKLAGDPFRFIIKDEIKEKRAYQCDDDIKIVHDINGGWGTPITIVTTKLRWAMTLR